MIINDGLKIKKCRQASRRVVCYVAALREKFPIISLNTIYSAHQNEFPLFATSLRSAQENKKNK